MTGMPPAIKKKPKKAARKGLPGILLGKTLKDQLLCAYGEQFVMLAAEPGSGKGVGVVIPNLLTYPDSVVVFDPKGENWNITSGWRQSQGHECYCFRPNSLQSHRWNPLDTIRRDPVWRLGDIDAVGSVLFSAGAEAQNASFFRTAQNFFTAILLFLLDSEPHIPVTLPQIYEIACTPEGLDEWAKSVIRARRERKQPLSDECERELSVIIAAGRDAETFTSFTGILKQRLSLYAKKSVAAAVSHSDFDFDDLRKRKISVYVCLTVEELENAAMRQLINLLFSLGIRQNTRVEPKYGGQDENGDLLLKYQALFLMDEFAVLGCVEIMKIAPALTRSYNVRYLIIFQNKDQLRSPGCYGLQGANAIMDAFHIEIVFAMGSFRAAEEYSKRLGNTTRRVTSRSRSSGGKGSSSGTNTSLHARPLMLPQEIQEMPYDEELIFMLGSRRSKPLKVRAKKIFWYEDKFFTARANKAPPEPAFLSEEAALSLCLTATKTVELSRSFPLH